MNFPSLFLNKEKLCKAIYLYEIEDLVKKKLSAENLKILEGDLDLRDQIFIFYWNNRFFTSLPKERVLEAVNNCIDTYKFLLDSNLEPEEIRYTFMKALMDVISVGSRTYFLSWDAWYNRHWYTRNKYPGKSGWDTFAQKRHKYWRIFRFTWRKVNEMMEQKYPLIPDSIRFSEDLIYEVGMREMENRYPFSEQLLVSFSYPLFLLRIRRKINISEFEKDFFIKHRWCLERMSSCNPIFLNKYREEVCREISYDLGLDSDPSYFRWGYFQNNPTFPSKNLDFLDKISEAINRCFSDIELELFREVDSEKNLWNFSDQIKDRYYAKYPSLAPFQEIEDCIKGKVSEYRVLLRSETKEVIREVLFDEIESLAFVSRPTHLWNLEMMENLKKGKATTNKKIVKAVDFLLSLFSWSSIEFLSIEVSGRKCSLRDQLLARWKRAWFASNLKVFENYLNTMHIHTIHSIDVLRDKQVISWIDIQVLLEKVDIFFLYPNRARFIKKIFRRLDTGRTVSGVMEKFRANASYELNIDPALVIRELLFSICLLIFLLISLFLIVR